MWLKIGKIFVEIFLSIFSWRGLVNCSKNWMVLGWSFSFFLSIWRTLFFESSMAVPPKLTLSVKGSVPSELFFLKALVYLRMLKLLRVLYFVYVSSASNALDFTRDSSFSLLSFSYFSFISSRLISSSLNMIYCSRPSIKNLSSSVWQPLIFFLVVSFLSFITVWTKFLSFSCILFLASVSFLAESCS